MNKNLTIQRINVSKGLSLYKTGRSPYYFARIWDPINKKYFTRSTKETTRIDARQVAQELFLKLHNTTFKKIPSNKTFNYFSTLLMKQQKAMSGKTRSKRFHLDDESLLLRKVDGINEYFGNKDIKEITTYDLRNYLTVLDENRQKGLSASFQSKHLIVISKVLKIAYEKGILDKIPMIPKISKKDNPRPTFTENQYKLFLKTTREIIEKEEKVRGIQITEELYYFFVFIVHSFMRPIESEIFSDKHKDIEVKYKPNRLEIRVKGKTGYRVVSTMPDALDFYDKLRILNPNYKPDDYLFFNNYPNRSTAIRNVNRQFNYILNLAGIKETSDGQSITPYALRHYSLQTRLLKSKGKVNIFNLAKNAGTSVEQLERFYLKNLEMNDDLVENLQTF